MANKIADRPAVCWPVFCRSAAQFACYKTSLSAGSLPRSRVAAAWSTSWPQRLLRQTHPLDDAGFIRKMAASQLKAISITSSSNKTAQRTQTGGSARLPNSPLPQRPQRPQKTAQFRKASLKHPASRSWPAAPRAARQTPRCPALRVS